MKLRIIIYVLNAYDMEVSGVAWMPKNRQNELNAASDVLNVASKFTVNVYGTDGKKKCIFNV